MTKKLGLVFFALVLLVVPVFASCGDGGADASHEVVIGFLADFTGPASLTCIALEKGFSDYMKMVEEDDPIPGTKIKLIGYDVRMVYARAVPGYLWLRGQGAQLIWNFSPVFVALLKDRTIADKIPTYTLQADPTTVDQDYVYNFAITYEIEAEAMMHWLVEEWEKKNMGRPMKVGHMGVAGYESSVQMSAVFQKFAAENAAKIELKEQFAPVGNMAFAVEIGRLRDSDFIIMNTIGPPTAAFVKESRDRGYENKYLGSSLCFMGFWDLIRNALRHDLGKLDGAMAIHGQMLWTDDTEFVAKLNANLARFRSPAEAEKLKKGTSWPTGQITGMILTDMLRRAVDQVGADNVNAAALNDALKGIDLSVDGWGESWEFRDDSNMLYRMLRVIEYRPSDDDWFAITDWFLPPGFSD